MELEAAGYGTPVYHPAALQPAMEQLVQYFARRRQRFDLPLDLRSLSPFARRVLETVSQIDYGEVASYGEIARRAGRPGAARAAGTAVAENPISIVIPCHRIIRADGTAGEYALSSLGPCGRVYKQALLDLEAPRYNDPMEGADVVPL
jgi:methylated-DNA-[protein]-cysteine S-methyltransferase